MSFLPDIDQSSSTTLDLDLLASIASGGLGRWVTDDHIDGEQGSGGGARYVKDEDCLGELVFCPFLVSVSL